jgi:DNA-binding transcriptional LysR family regulator
VTQSILNNEILLGCVGAHLDSNKLQFHPFMDDDLVLAASTKRILNQRITTRTLVELPFILREEGSGTRKCMEQYLSEKNISVEQLNTCAVLGSSTAVTEAIKSNLGVSILSRQAVKDGVEYGQIQTIDILDIKMTRHFYAVTSSKRSLPHHYHAFLKYLLPSAGKTV